MPSLWTPPRSRDTKAATSARTSAATSRRHHTFLRKPLAELLGFSVPRPNSETPGHRGSEPSAEARPRLPDAGAPPHSPAPGDSRDGENQSAHRRSQPGHEGEKFTGAELDAAAEQAVCCPVEESAGSSSGMLPVSCGGQGSWNTTWLEEQLQQLRPANELRPLPKVVY